MPYAGNEPDHTNGLVQDCSNSIANALELLQSCTKSLIHALVGKPYGIHCDNCGENLLFFK